MSTLIERMRHMTGEGAQTAAESSRYGQAPMSERDMWLSARLAVAVSEALPELTIKHSVDCSGGCECGADFGVNDAVERLRAMLEAK